MEPIDRRDIFLDQRLQCAVCRTSLTIGTRTTVLVLGGAIGPSVGTYIADDDIAATQLALAGSFWRIEARRDDQLVLGRSRFESCSAASADQIPLPEPDGSAWLCEPCSARHAEGFTA